MKKMVLMAAFVAAGAAFVACSNENDLVQQAPEVPEESTVKYPMTITVSTPSTRGTDFDDTSLKKFKMYSNYHSTWNNGALFEKNDNGAWVNKYNAQMAWSEDDVTNNTTYTFYGVNDFDNFSVVSAVTQKPTVSESTVSFGYTMPIKTRDTDSDGNPDESYVDYEDQVDLLVAKATAGPTVGSPLGALNVEFNHALARISKILVYCSAARMASNGMDADDDVPTWRFRINGIRIGGLKAAGTYTFDADKPWTTTGDDVEFSIPLDDTKMTFADMAFQPGSKDDAIELPLTDDGLFLVPQLAAGALTDDSSIAVGEWAVVGPYVEFDAQVGHYGIMGDETSFVYDYALDESKTRWNATHSDAAKFRTIRVPLKFDIRDGGNKVYTLLLDISRAIVCEDGDNLGEGDPIFGDNITITAG